MNLLGRFFFSLPFLVLSIYHFRNAEKMIEAMPQWLPWGVVWVYLTAAIYIFAATSILVLRKARPACLILGIALSITVVAVHLPNLTNPLLSDQALTNLLKDTSLAGAAFYFSVTLRRDRDPGAQTKRGSPLESRAGR